MTKKNSPKGEEAEGGWVVWFPDVYFDRELLLGRKRARSIVSWLLDGRGF